MSRTLLRRPSPALVVACLALAVALSGTGYAVTKLPKNSVGTVQLKKNAVTSVKVRNGALLAADFAKGQIPPGPGGPGGPKGDKGDRGEKGDKGDRGDPGATKVTYRTAPGGSAGPGSWTYAIASCLPGETLVGGGGHPSWSPPAKPTLMASLRYSPTSSSWSAQFRNDGTGGSVQANASVLCASP